MQPNFLDVRYHQQDKDTFCGPAAAQMVLSFVKPGTPSQEVLEHAVPSGPNDGMSPARLRATLNHEKGSYPLTFVACHDGTACAGVRRIAETICLTGVAVPSIICGDHWVVVTGVALDGEPPPSNSYTIRGFFVHNPSPDTPDTFNGAIVCQLPQPHGGKDCCGRGSVFGSPNTYVTLDAWVRHSWRTFYVDPNHVEPSGYVTVCAERNPPPDAVRQTAGTPVVAPPPAPGAAAIGEAAALIAARRGIDSHKIGAEGPLAAALANAVAAFAWHVDDASAGLCYCVSMEDPLTHTLVALAFVGAFTGEFFGAQSPPSNTPAPFDQNEFVKAALMSSAPELQDIFTPAMIDNHEFTIKGPPFWRPTRQSMSPYYPFIRVDVGGTDLFVGEDRRVYRVLDDHP